jgi:glycerol kinase
VRIAAIDQGTTSTRCLVVEDGGAWRVTHSSVHRQYHRHAGWTEHDATELLDNVREAIRSAGPCYGIALANQGESCLAWDALTGEPLSPVVVWNDTRTRDELARMSEADWGRSEAVSGLPLDPYFSASKLGWLLRNLPSVAAAHAQRRLRMGTTDAFFIDRLTGHFATDVTTASRTGLLDLGTATWSEELCAMHGVPIECLPRIGPVDGDLGHVNGVPLLVSIVDQQAALHGHGCRINGDCKITFGTGAFLLVVGGTERPSRSALTPTIAWQRRAESMRFAIEGGVYDAGRSLEWARSIGLFADMSEIDQFDGPTAISRGLAFVPAFSGLAAPHWDRRAAPLFIGMDHSTGRRDLLKAVLEGVAMLTAGLIEEAARIESIGEIISIDGGLSQSRYFAGFLATASNRTIRVPPMRELTALGLAELCGLEVEAARAGGAHFHPDHSITKQDRSTHAQAVHRAKTWRH